MIKVMEKGVHESCQNDEEKLQKYHSHIILNIKELKAFSLNSEER